MKKNLMMKIVSILLLSSCVFAQVTADNKITKEVAEDSLERLEVDALGFDDMDKRIILTIIDKYNGGPVGVNTISVAVGEESNTIEEVYEPYLIQQGYIKRTPRGREATARAYEHFNITTKRTKKQQGDIFSTIPPQAAAIAFIKYDLDINSTQLAERLIKEKSVLIIPGDHFGLDKFLRVSYGLPEEYLLSGLARIQELIHTL